MSLHIRKAKPSDAPDLACIGATTFYETFRPYNQEEDMRAYIGKTYSEEAVRENLLREDIAYYLCFEGSEVIGYVKLIHNAEFTGLTDKCIELEKIYVLETYHGTKAGQELMDCAVQHGSENGFGTIFLGVWQENKRAIRFYEKNGFEVFATRSFQLGTRLCEDYMMKRWL